MDVSKKGGLNHNEKLIIKELIKDPRISDNQISKNSGVPLKTVNRRRKILEEEKILSYFVNVNNSVSGTGNFLHKHIYTVSFNYGITRLNALDIFNNSNFPNILSKHCHSSFFAEGDGSLKLILIIESYNDLDIFEIFNADYLPKIKSLFGNDSIKKVDSLVLSKHLQFFHNYFPDINMKNGKIRSDYNNIFIG